MRTKIFAVGALLLAGSVSGACGADTEPNKLCAEGEVLSGTQCLLDYTVATNTVGYLPERAKKAAFSVGSDYEVVNNDTGDVVLSGTGLGPFPADGGLERRVADFSEITEPGTYYVRAGSERSAPFTIGASALQSATEAAMLGLYGQRCGEAVEFEHDDRSYAHGACHLAKATVTWDDPQEEKDDTGGWHDAGDYGKYVRNGAFAVAFLLQAWEHYPEILKDWEFEMPERGGDVPDILDEARVELEWILKTQFDDGSFAHKVTAENFEANIMPTSDGQARFFFSTSTHSTANAVAVLAAAARIYEEFDADFAASCLESAERGFAFLQENAEIASIMPEKGTGTYGSTGDKDERAWAAAELWETTGTASYLTSFEEVQAAIDASYDWPSTYNLAVVTYLGSARQGRDEDKVASLTWSLIDTANRMSEAAVNDPFGRGFTSYYWGSAGVAVRIGHTLAAAHRLFPNKVYLDGISLRLDHVLGLNPFARSFVTAVGANPPQNPHHRPSSQDGVGTPWPGLLIGGPNGDPGAWDDNYDSYQTNEIAINWSTALIYSLIAAQATQEDESAACVPNCVEEPSTSMGGAPGNGGAGGAGE